MVQMAMMQQVALNDWSEQCISTLDGSDKIPLVSVGSGIARIVAGALQMVAGMVFSVAVLSTWSISKPQNEDPDVRVANLVQGVLAMANGMKNMIRGAIATIPGVGNVLIGLYDGPIADMSSVNVNLRCMLGTRLNG